MKAKVPHGYSQANVGAEYTPEEIEFLKAVDNLKKTRKFPTLIELYHLLISLGYRRVEESK